MGSAGGCSFCCFFLPNPPNGSRLVNIDAALCLATSPALILRADRARSATSVGLLEEGVHVGGELAVVLEEETVRPSG